MDFLKLSEVVKESEAPEDRITIFNHLELLGCTEEQKQLIATIPYDKMEEVFRAIVLIMDNKELRVVDWRRPK